MRFYWIGVTNPMMAVLIRRGEFGNKGVEERGPHGDKAEVGVMLSHVKESQELPATSRSSEETRQGPSLVPLQGQPRDPCRPWRGTLASGHKPR